MALVGCGGGDTGTDSDAGGEPFDGGGQTDGGGSGDDGGGPEDDGGSAEDDGGTSEPDGGTPVADGGLSLPDASIIGRDGGPQLDGGVPAGCLRCTREQFCATPDGMCDVGGTCMPRPELCPGIFLPVCGCDGMTYSNDCAAHAAGQSVAFEGECPAVRDCRTAGCPGRATCEPCRGGGYVCLPPGTAC